MSKSINLTEGNILKSLIKLAIPIIGTSFMQMAYNFTDVIWVGRIGADAVAAVGTAGFFLWLSMALIAIPRIGAEVGVAQSLGRNDSRGVREAVKHSIQMMIVLALAYGAFLLIFRKPLMNFYRLGAAIEEMAIDYLVIICWGMLFATINPVFTAIFNGAGDSKTPFRANTIGLIVNIILDPLLIFGVGPFPALGVRGAAFATIIAQIIVTLLFIAETRMRPELFAGVNLFKRVDGAYLKRMCKMGLPIVMQSGFFTIISMFLTRIIAGWGPLPVAVQSVGSEIESISWMTAGGFQSAMGAFVGQNFGAKKWERIYKGYFVGLGIAAVIGLFTTSLLIFGARPIFSIFIPQEEAIAFGVVYLKILGLSQFFMALEIITAGAFIGQGKTSYPSIVSIVLNALRIPVALILSSTALGLNGIWWAICISSILKGSILCVLYLRYLKVNPNTATFRVLKMFSSKTITNSP